MSGQNNPEQLTALDDSFASPSRRAIRVIVRARASDLGKANDIIFRELSEFKKYDRIGWGWTFGRDPTFFVRRIKDGLSCTARYRDGGEAVHSQTADAVPRPKGAKG